MKSAAHYVQQAENEIDAGVRFNDNGHLENERNCLQRALVFALLAIASAVEDVDTTIGNK